MVNLLAIVGCEVPDVGSVVPMSAYDVYADVFNGVLTGDVVVLAAGDATPGMQYKHQTRQS